ncbi:MAG: ABC transporter substrate-binding protein [Candidatus Sericytochromatia bacterium]|nr:ABC transporter substrate-binding protein [Candidatus Sericytochromatia bacterium]
MKLLPKLRSLRTALALCCSLSLLAPLSACHPEYTDRAVYRSAFEGDVPSLDPIQIGDTQSHDVAHNIYNGLVRYRPEITEANSGQELSDLVPDLAESWQVSEDGRTYTFKLRQGVKFHHGRELEAADVKYSFERLADPGNASRGMWTLNALRFEGLDAFQEAREAGNKEVSLDSIQVLDKYTVSLTLERVIPFALHVLAMSYYYIVPREVVEQYGDQFTFNATGTGPFKLREWKPNQRLVLTKNEDFFRAGEPHLDELRFYIVPDENIRLLWFENGELEHLEPPIPAASFDRILSDPKWNKMGNDAIRKIERVNDPERSQIIKDREWTIQYLGLDTADKPFNDKRVRKAFNYAINKRKIIDVVRNGRGVEARGVLPHGFPGFKPDRPVPYPYDLKKAKALMAEAGWRDSNGDGILDKDGEALKLTFWHNQSAIYAMLGAAVQSDLRELGVDVDVRAMEWASYIEKVKRNEAKIFRFGWAADYPDPDNYLWTLFHSQNIGQDNVSRYSNPAFDALVDKARNLTDWEQRKPLYQQAESMIVEDAPWIFLYTNIEYKLVQPYVKGQQMHPLIRNELAMVKLER